MKLFILCLSFVAFITLASGLDVDSGKPGQKRRRKLRRKVVKKPQEEIVLEGEGVTYELADPLKSEPSEVVLLAEDREVDDVQGLGKAELDRSGRGFLDQYYSQFEDRIPGENPAKKFSTLQRKTGQAALDLMPQGSIRLPANINLYDDLEDEDLLDLDEYVEYDDIEDNLGESARYLRQSAGPNTHYVQHVALPKTGPSDDSTYMYSAVHNNDLEDLEGDSSNNMPQEPRKILPGFLYTGTKQMKEDMLKLDEIPFEPSTHLEYSSAPDIGGLLDRDGSSHHHHEHTSSYEAPSTSYKTAESSPLTKFLGLTGTTSQDIQLGLTFTVPFLSIPLTSLNSVFDGNGLTSLFDGVDFSTLFTVAAMVAAGVFLVPYAIYWLTGINLSAFTGFGRSDDPEGDIPLAGLMRKVEDALSEYNIDTRQCLARTMCNQYSTRSIKDETPDRIGRGLLENIAQHKYVKQYVGESMVQDALSHGSKKSCSKVYKKDVCPWDGAAMMKIVTSLITSGKIDFASIAAAAAQAAAKNFV